MKLIIARHTADRMAERQVTRSDIEHAIGHHHTRLPTPKHSILYIGPGMDGRDLKVWVWPDDINDLEETKRVKSVAWRGVDDH